MKKLLIGLILSFVFGGISMVAAQTSGLNNNSDWKVPVPMPSLPQGGSNNNAGAIAAAISAAVIPTIPAIIPMIVPASFTAAIGNLNVASIIPALPTTPSLPTLPTAIQVASVAVVPPLASLPILPALPPIPPIPPTPALRLVAPARVNVDGRANSEKEK